jgi:hypothetical protein
MHLACTYSRFGGSNHRKQEYTYELEQSIQERECDCSGRVTLNVANDTAPMLARGVPVAAFKPRRRPATPTLLLKGIKCEFS